MTDTTTASTTSAGINKTNLDYIDHHFRQAVVSLDRALGRLELVTNGKTGRLAKQLSEDAGRQGYNAVNEIGAALGTIHEVATEINEMTS